MIIQLGQLWRNEEITLQTGLRQNQIRTLTNEILRNQLKLILKYLMNYSMQTIESFIQELKEYLGI